MTFLSRYKQLQQKLCRRVTLFALVDEMAVLLHSKYEDYPS